MKGIESINEDFLQAMDEDEKSCSKSKRFERLKTPPPKSGLGAGNKHQLSPETQFFTSPSKNSAKRRMSSIHDRFIPDRQMNIDYQTAFSLVHNHPMSPLKQKQKQQNSDIDAHKDEMEKLYSKVLRSEMFGPEFGDLQNSAKSSNHPASSLAMADQQLSLNPNSSVQPSKPKKKFLQFPPLNERPSSARRLLLFDPFDSTFSTSPMNASTQKTLSSPRKPPRNISKVPYKILDAPDLADDFYLNVVDWGSDNLLGVGLNTAVYLWNPCTSRVTKLCDLAPYDTVSSLNWAQKGSHLAVGTSRGEVQLWDVRKQKNVRTFTGHSGRVGSLAWNENVLSTGSRDRSILHRDIRSPEQFTQRLVGHRQEVCGLKWSLDNQLASGGNDNKLLVWDRAGASSNPLYKFSEHKAAVKAISWSPHQHGLLVSGGGTADRKIRFWNTLTGLPLHSVDTGSQVCNLSWSKNSNELVSTHGYSQNQIVVWKYPSLQQIAVLTGHTFRVLYLAMSPDGQTVVTGAGDETLRFWNVFAKKKDMNSVESILASPRKTIR